MKTSFYSDKDETHYHKKVALGLVLKVAVFGTWQWPIEHRAYDELHCGILVEKNNPGYPKIDFLVNYCSFSRLGYYKPRQCVITIHDSSAYHNLRQHVITIYDSLVITILDDCYYNLRRTGITILDIITIHDKTYGTQYLLVQ